MIKIKEIFYSPQGEGIYTGVPMLFVRLAGCNMVPKCLYCDTRYAWDPEDGRNMEIPEILEEMRKLSPYYKMWVCITGGEPLWQEDGLEQLVRELKKNGYSITIETNGSFRPPRWYSLVDSWNADMKCPSSGVCGVSDELWFRTRFCDQVKFVVSNSEDLEFARGIINKHKVDPPTVLVSPSTGLFVDKQGGKIEEYWNKELLQEVAEFCKEMRVRFSLQLHKVIWGNKEGV